MYATDSDPRGDLTRPVWERECLMLSQRTDSFASQMDGLWAEAQEAIAARTADIRSESTADNLAAQRN